MSGRLPPLLSRLEGICQTLFVAINKPRPTVDPADLSGLYRDILSAFQEVAIHATGATDLNEVLYLVGRRICDLLGLKRFSVYLKGEDGFFHGQVGLDHGKPVPRKTMQRMRAGFEADRFTNEIVATKAPVLITDASHDPRTIARTMRRWRVRDILGVPLVFAGDVIGIIYVDNAAEEHRYTEQEIRVAQTFASLAALAIRQAWLRLQVSSKALVIEKQNALLEQMAEIHRRLTRAVLEGAGVGTVLNLLAELVGKPVVLYDERREVVGWAPPPGSDLLSPPCISLDAFAADHVAGALAQLSLERPSMIVPAGPALGCRHVVCQLVIEDAPAGYLDVVEIGRPISHLDIKVAEHGATVLSLQILSERRQAEAEGQAREDFLVELLHGGREPGQLVRRAPVFGMDLGSPHVVVRLAHTSETGTDLTGPARRRLLAETIAAGLGGREPLAVSVPGADILLVQVPAGPEPEALRCVKRAVEAALAKLLASSPGGRAAVSGVCRSVEDYPQVDRELSELMAFTRDFGWREGAILTSELGIMRLLALQGSPASALRFASDLLHPLIEHDRNGQGRLLATLRAYIEEGAQVRETARRLEVHENTVRYRLSRIREMSSIDPARFESLIDARLAFQVLELAGRDQG